jgi:probable HAF family extracellular repeat protein
MEERGFLFLPKSDGLARMAVICRSHTTFWLCQFFRAGECTLPGDIHSVAEGINIAGQMLGRSSDADFNGRGYAWQNGVMTDFNTLIPAKFLCTS